MEKLESIKKTSKIIRNIGNVCQIIFGILTGITVISIVIIFLLRNQVNLMAAEGSTSFYFHNMGSLAQQLADEGKIADAFLVFGLFMIVYLIIITVIMHLISRIFRKFYDSYSPFLPDVIKDIIIIFILITLLVLRNSLGLGVILAFVLWGIIQIYRYGCELQNQSDETL